MRHLLSRGLICCLLLAACARSAGADSSSAREYLSQADAAADRIGLGGDQSAARREIALALTTLEVSAAREASAGISRPSDAARVLGGIAAALSEQDPAAAKQAAATAARLLLRISDPERRLEEQRLLLGVVAPLGAEALVSAPELKPEEARPIVVTALARSRPEKALELVKTWQLAGPRADQAFAALAPRLATSQPEAAAELAGSITSPELREVTLWLVAERYPLGEAMAVTPRMQDPIIRDGLLASVAVRICQTDPEAALAAVEALTVSPASGRAALAVDMVGGDEARAVALARQLPPRARDWALGRIAFQLAQAKPEQAEAYLKESGRAAETVRVVAARMAATDPERALRVARTIPEGEEREAALAAVAVALAPSQTARARDLIAEINSSRGKARAVEAVSLQLARQDSEAAISLLGLIADAEALLRIRAKIAVVVARRDPDLAQRLLQTTPASEYRSTCAYAAALAHLESSGAPERAVQLAAAAMDKGVAARWLLATIAQSGRGSASEIAEGIEDPYLRVLGLVEVARALSGSESAARPAPERARMIRAIVEWEGM